MMEPQQDKKDFDMQVNEKSNGMLGAVDAMRINAKLSLLVTLFIMGFIVFGWVAYGTIRIVMVNGPYYKSIVQGKDLIADVLPPPEYLIESYLVVLEMNMETDRKKLDELVSRSKTLRAEFDLRHDFWTQDLPEGPLKSEFLKDSYLPAMEFLEKRDKEFIPAVLAGDRQTANRLATGFLKEKYEQHLTSILRVVQMATDRNKEDEKAAAATIRSRFILLFSLCLGILAFVSLACWYFIRQITGPLYRVAGHLSDSSKGLTQVSQQMGANAEETSAQANLVSVSSQQVNQSVQTVATGTEEMSASIREIAKSTNESVRVANNAVKVADSTNIMVSKLGTSSAEIGNVIKVITSIAEQTNLLALNATIEAARAGEAGKGFAVVANEVKELARETAKATEDISRKIEAIQSDTRGAISAIGEISSIIGQISDIQNTIASAVEEQTATTNEIARNVSEAARGSTEITRNIGGVATAAQSTAEGAIGTQKAAGSLVDMANQLQRLVG